MPIEITDRKDSKPMFKSDKAIYLNADKTETVEEGSPDAAFLLVGAGSEIEDSEAAKYGLKSSDKTEDKAAAPEDDKSDEEKRPTRKSSK